jgi:hypothetical protein
VLCVLAGHRNWLGLPTVADKNMVILVNGIYAGSAAVSCFLPSLPANRRNPNWFSVLENLSPRTLDRADPDGKLGNPSDIGDV